MTVVEGKEWAEGLSQHEFEAEYARRNPGTDSIPALEKWLYREWPVYHGIPNINPDDIKYEDTPRGVKTEDELRIEFIRYCEGCKKEFKAVMVNGKLRPNYLALAKHEKSCKTLLLVKT